MNIHFKSPSALLLLGALLVSSGCKRSGDDSGPPNALKRYPYERLHLTYEYAGDVRGSEEFFSSEYGKYESRYSNYEILVPQDKPIANNGSITRLSDIYEINFLDKMVVHDHSVPLDSLYHLDPSDIPSPQTYLDNEMKNHYLRNKGTEMVEGKPATKWEADGGSMTIWVWNSILMRKHVVNDHAVMDMEIKSIDSLWTVDTTKFTVPAGFTKMEKPAHAPPTD